MKKKKYIHCIVLIVMILALQAHSQSATQDYPPAITGAGTPEAPVDYTSGNMMQAIFDAESEGTDFWMDRVLQRPGEDPTNETDGQFVGGLLSKGNALFMFSCPQDVLGFDGASAYLNKYVGNSGVGRPEGTDKNIYIIELSTGDVTENISKRFDTPSHWRSEYSSGGIAIKLKKFITENNSAVTSMDFTNTTGAPKTFTMRVTSERATSGSGDELRVIFDPPNRSISLQYESPTVTLKISGDGMTVSGPALTRSITLAAGAATSVKVIAGFITEEVPASATEYETYKGYDANTALKTHVTQYNQWWVENIPYIDVPGTYFKKMINYRWWLTRFTTMDARLDDGPYKFPILPEGVLGYNYTNRTQGSWAIDESRYFREPVACYGSWLNLLDNRHPDYFNEYIAAAGWDSYKVHGGQPEFLKIVADKGENMAERRQRSHDPDENFILKGMYDGWDATACAGYYPGGSQERTNTTAYYYRNVKAVSEMFAVLGEDAKATEYAVLKDNISNALVTHMFDEESGEFLNRNDNGWVPWLDIDHYWIWLDDMIPDEAKYKAEPLKKFADPTEFAVWPAYVVNLKDYQEAKDAGGRPNLHYAPQSTWCILRAYANLAKNYTDHPITPEYFKRLLAWYTWAQYMNADGTYPDVNEFYSGWDDATNTIMWKSWIHHCYHSAYNVLVIENIIGLTPRADATLELHPIDMDYDHFLANNLKYHGQDINIIWDKPGDGTTHYQGVPEGYSLYVNGTRVATVDALAHITWNSKTGEVAVVGGTANVLYNKSGYMPTAIQVHHNKGRMAELFEQIKVPVDYTPVAKSQSGLNNKMATRSMLAADELFTIQDIMIADFAGSDYENWKTTGTAFGNGPAQGAAASGNGGDAATGTLTSPSFTIRRGYINFQISGGNWPDDLNVQLIVDGKPVRRAYAGHQDRLFWFSWDTLDLSGRSAVIVVNDNYSGKMGHIAVDNFQQSNTRRGMDELYRPQFHISAQWNHINDPDGLVYYDGEYHVFHQWSPFTLNHGKKHWGHLVSTDLIHWKYLRYALTPTEGYGKGGCAAYSGSAVVDENNTAGFQTGDEQPIVAIWTAIGCGQYIAYSNDRGRNFTWYEANPVIPQNKDDRDPMVRWHEPTRKWVMALPETREEGRILAFYVSDDLKNWTRTGTVNGVGDCPDYYKLPVDGNPDNQKWVLYGGHGSYRFGEFDGTTFIDEGGGVRYPLWRGNQYATQTFDNTPDGRKIMMVWVVDNKMPPGMPYSQMLSFPVEIKLKTFPEGVRAAAAPIQEIELLHDTKHSWSDETIGSGGNLLSGLSGKLFDIRAEFEIGTASEFGFRIRGMGTVSYNVNNSQARLNGNITKNNDWNMAPDKGRVKIQILVDRSIIEAFFDDGRAYLMSTFFPDDSDQSLEIFSSGGDTKLVSMGVYELKSSWDYEQVTVDINPKPEVP